MVANLIGCGRVARQARFFLALAALLLGHAACESSEPASNNADGGPSGNSETFAAGALPWRSGSRLRARILDGGDGASAFVGWFDSQLKTACTFRHATDGRLRCIPEGGGDAVVFLDAECRNAVGYRPGLIVSGDPPRFLRTRVPGTCGLPDDVRLESYEVTGTTTVPAAYFDRTDDGGCLRHEVVSGEWLSISAVAPERMVDGVAKDVSGSEALVHRVIAGSDGSRSALGFWYRDSGRRCWVPDLGTDSRNLQQQPECLPIDLAYGQRCFAFATPLCPIPTLSFELPPQSCALPSPKIEFFSITGPDPDRGASGFCADTGKITPELVTVASATSGTGRLRALFHADQPGHLVLQDQVFLDAPLHPPLTPQRLRFTDTNGPGSVCEARRFRDGPSSFNKLLCVPTTTEPQRGNLFADAACTNPLHEHRPPCASDPVPTHVLLPALVNATDVFESAYRVVGRFSGVFYLRPGDDDSSCIPQPAGSPQNVYATEPADLVTLVERTE